MYNNFMSLKVSFFSELYLLISLMYNVWGVADNKLLGKHATQFNLARVWSCAVHVTVHVPVHVPVLTFFTCLL